MANKNQNKPRIKLLNKLTLVILAVTSLWALWLVAPTQTTLLQLIARSTSPDVSLAFLQQIYRNTPSNEKVISQMIDNYIALGEHNKAMQLLETRLNNPEGEKDWKAMSQYLSLLLQQSYQADPDEKSILSEKILSLLNSIDSIPSPEVARQFANTAIAFSLPHKGYELLAPHLKSGYTSHQELLSLALQSEDYQASLKLIQDAFKEHETLELANTLFHVFTTTSQAEMSREFLLHYKGKLSNDPHFLKNSIEHSLKIGNQDIAAIQSTKLLAIQPTAELYTIVAKTNVAQSKPTLAIANLKNALALEPSEQNYQLLHDLYRWQGDILNAQKTSLKLITYSQSEKILRNGIEESKALGDISNEAYFYTALARNNILNPDDYSAWLNALEKSEGTVESIKELNKQRQKLPDNPALISQIMRLYSYQDHHLDVISLGKKLTALRPLTKNEIELFANAYMMNNQPEQALKILTSLNNWTSEDEDYLSMVADLAWNSGNRAVFKTAQNQLVNLSIDNFDPFRYLQLLTPIDDNNIQQVIELYRRTKHPELLLAAIEHSTGNEHVKRLTMLLDMASRESSLKNNLDIMNYTAMLAMKQNRLSEAKQIYNYVLSIDPYNITAINSLIWLAIDSQDQPAMADIYNKYKIDLATNSDLWLGFASLSQQLNHPREAILWYKRILQVDTSDPAILLSYATLLEQQGQAETAYQLRHYVIEKEKDTLLQQDYGDISYRSLLALYKDKKIAYQLAELAATNNPSSQQLNELYHYYQAEQRLDKVQLAQKLFGEQFSLPANIQLAIAIEQKDEAMLETLLGKVANIDPADKYIALQLLGKQHQAWKEAEAKIGMLSDKQSEANLRNIHVQQHPHKSKTVRIKTSMLTQWDVNRYSIASTLPHPKGNWLLEYQYQQADTPDIIEGTTIDDELRFLGNFYYRFSHGAWHLGWDIANGIGDTRWGIEGAYQTTKYNDWSLGININLNSHIEASQLLNIAGKDHRININASYQPTARETVNLDTSYHWLSTRFGDNLGHGWDMHLRFTEHLFLADPAWALYGDLTLQKINHSNQPPDKFNQWQQGPIPLSSEDFFDSEYHRIAIGQRLWHGEPGLFGATVPSPQYWLDTSLGYNITNARVDFSISAGLGWQIIGNDELFLATDWQSQDRNGEESFNLSFGYHYRF